MDQTKHTAQESIRLVAEKIKSIRTAMLTTVETDGTLHSRPMGTIEVDFDGTLWFFTKSRSGKVHAIENDQHVNVSYSDDHKNRWISVAGRAHIINDRTKMKELWTPLLKAWFPEGVDDPDLRLLGIEVESAQIWDAPGGKLIVLANFARALLTGKPMKKGSGSEKIDIRH